MRNHAHRNAKGPVLEAMEERQLFSIDIPGADALVHPTQPTPIEAVLEERSDPTGSSVTASDSGAEASFEIVFVDTATPDYQTLVDGLVGDPNRHFEVIYIDSDQDGLKVISDHLASASEVDAIHLISHGAPGEIELGNQRLTEDLLVDNATRVAAWSTAFSQDGDILIYGCDLASTVEGEQLVDSLALLTSADVAASDDLTGQASLGGDWDLEYRTGAIEADIAFTAHTQSTFEGVLALINFREGSSGYASTQDTYLREASATTGQGGDTDVQVDLNDSGGQEQALIRFDDLFGSGPYQIPLGSTINSAELTVEVTNQSSSGATISLHRMLSNWDESSTWDSMTTGISTDDIEAKSLGDATVPTPDALGSITITGLSAALQAWSDGDTNYGWAILSDDTNGWGFASSENGTSSLRPVLSVDYTPPPVPSDLVVTDNASAGTELNADGGNDAYLVADDGGAILGGLSAATFELQFEGANHAGIEIFISYNDPTGNDEFSINTNNNTVAGAMELDFGAGGTVESTAVNYETLLLDAARHTLSVTWDNAAGAWEIYVDGSLIDSGSGLNTGNTITAGGTLLFGQEQDALGAGFNSGEYFSGTLHDARLFNDVRTAGEISSNYQATLPNTEPGMIANWLFDNLSTDGVVTESMSGNNLTVAHVSDPGFTSSTPSLPLSVDENAANSTVVGTLAAIHPNGGETFTYSLLDHAGGRFTINSSSGELSVANGSLLDFETAASHNITARVVDSDGDSYDEVFTITVNDLNEAPVITSDGGGITAALNVAENTTTVTTVTSDDDDGDTVTYSITGGADQGLFNIDTNTGVLTFVSAPNFESPTDSDTNGVYEVAVTASDGNGGTDVQTISVTVTDINDPPINNVPGAQIIDQNGMLLFSASTGTAITISDDDAGGAAIEVTLTASNGTVNLASSAGLTFTLGDGTDDASMTFTGTIAAINTALEGMTFVATPGFTGAASLQVATDDLGNTGPGGAQSDSDLIAITVKAPDHTLWMTFENDQGATGNPDLPSFTAGDVVNFGGTLTFEPGTTAGTFSTNFNLDTVSGTDTRVNAVHYVTKNLSTGGVDLQTGDLLLSTNDNEVIGADTFNSEDVFVFRPTTAGDYSSGTFFLLIDGSDIGLGKVTGISLVEQDTVVGGETLKAGEILLAHDGSGKNIIRFEADSLESDTAGTTAVLLQGSDVNIGQNIGALHLVQADTAIGDTTLQAGQLLVGLIANDSTVGDTPTISVTRQDVFVLDITATGAGTSAATASAFFEGADENLDQNAETVWGVSAQFNRAPTLADASFSLDENSANGTLIGTLSASDAQNDTLHYTITAGNTDNAFAIDAATGQITVLDNTALDFEIHQTLTFTVAAIDIHGAYQSATVTVTLNNLDEAGTNDAPENTIPVTQVVDRNGILLFSATTGTELSISDFDAATNPVEVTLTATNGTFNLSGNKGLSFSVGDGVGDAVMTFTGTVADINTALEGSTFVASSGFVGAASLQLTTDDLGNAGTGGALSDTDTCQIQVEARAQRLWMTLEDDVSTTGNADIPSISGGDVLVYQQITQVETSNVDALESTTAGSFDYRFDLDDISGSDGNTRVDAIHYVKSDILVGGIQLLAGDVLFSTDARKETIDGVSYQDEDLILYRPTTAGDYSAGSFARLIDGSDIGIGDIRGISLVESTTVIGGVTLNSGELLLAHDGSPGDIVLYTPTSLGDTTAGTTSVLVSGSDAGVGIDQNISGLHLVQADTDFVGVGVHKGQLLVALAGNDAAVGGTGPIDVKRQDIFVLDVTSTGVGTSAASAERLIEGLDENLDSNKESIWGVSLQSNAAPELAAVSASIAENSPNGSLVTTVSATDPDNNSINYAIIDGNNNGVFAIDTGTGQVTVANTAALDFETSTEFTLTVAAIDQFGGATTATVMIDVLNVDEAGTNDAPENTAPDLLSIDRDGMLLFSSATGTALSVQDFDAGSNPIQVTLTATNGTLNLPGDKGLTFSVGDGYADTTMTFSGTLSDVNAALEGATFIATPGYAGAASIQITTNDLGNTGTGGTLSDIDTINISVLSADQQIWTTFENSEGTTGNTDIPSISGGDVVVFSNATQFETSNTDPFAATTSGTFASEFNLDTALLSDGITAASDGSTRVDALHYVTQDIVIGTNSIQLRAGDLLLSTDSGELIDGITYQKEDVFVFRPDASGDYSQGSFFRLIDGSDISLGKVTGISLVERSTLVGGTTLNPGDFLIAHDGSAEDIVHFTPGTLGNTTSGTTSTLIQGADIGIDSKIGGIHLMQADASIGGQSLTAGQLLFSLKNDDASVGGGTPISVDRHDIAVLTVTSTGAGTTSATADRFFEGLDLSLDSNRESIWGISLQSNIAPTMNTATMAVDENSANGTVVGNVSGSDPEDVTGNYAIINGNSNGAFAIDAATGQITVANSTMLDYETTTAFTLTVATVDSSGAYDTATVTININDVDEFDVTNPVDTDATADAVDENVANGTTVGITALASDADGTTNTITYSLFDDAGGRFAIDSSTGVVTVADGTLLDREAAASHDITARATSTDGSTADTLYTIALNDLDEFDVGTVTDSNVATNAVDENAANGTTVGVTALASDADATTNTITYSLDDSAGGRFAIDASTGVVTVADGTLLDREAATSHDITVRATSADGSFDTAVMTVNVNDVDEFDVGTVTDSNVATNAVDENAANGTTVGVTALASDDDATDSVTYSLDDDAGGRFAIDGSTGEVTVADGTLLDREAAASQDVTVRATSSDGSANTETMTIALDDVDEFDVGVVTDSDATANAVDENAANGTTVGVTALASDDDATDSVTYSLDDDAGGRFAIDGSTGEVTVADGTLLDREAAASQDVTVRATSSDGSANTETMTIALDDVDEFDVGVVTDSDATANAVDENAANGTTVGVTALASDDDATDSVTYSLDDDAGGRFAIDGSTGEVTVADGTLLDREADASYDITVRATSSDTSFSTAVMTINVLDSNETPAAVALSNNTVDENTDTSGGYSVGSLSTTDPDAGDTHSYSIVGGADVALFSIGGVGSNELIVNDGILDFETQSDYQVTVRTTDNGGLTHDQSFTVSVSDLNDAPEITSTAVTSATQDLAYSYTITSTDQDGDALTLSATTLPAWLSFTDHGDGTATLTGTPGNAEVGTHAVVIEARDGSLMDTQSFSITVSNINDAPVITSDGGGDNAAVTADENQTAVTTITSSDVDGDTATYTISGGADASRFSITADGVLSFNGAPDFENPTDHDGDGVYEVAITANDGNGGSDVQTISVTLSNVAELPPGTPVTEPPVPEEETIVSTQADSTYEATVEATPEAEETAEETPPQASVSDDAEGVAADATDVADQVGNETPLPGLEPNQQFDSGVPQPVVKIASQLFLNLMGAAAGIQIQPLGPIGSYDHFDYSDEVAMRQVLDQLTEEISRSADSDADFEALSVEAATAALSLTAGAVMWVLRTGSLAASLLSVMPVWQQIDPLPILSEGQNILDTDFDLDQHEELDLRSKAEDFFEKGGGGR